MRTLCSGGGRATWSVARGVRSRLRTLGTSLPWCRALFSKTGDWVPEFDTEVRKELESHWHPVLQSWDQLSSTQEAAGREKYYVLSMFPYPSGRLHMGHVRVYTISDAMARFHRLNGRQVIHPMGWDAFGLPAENAAIERGELPQEWTRNNISNMKKQLQALNYSFDWHREFATCDPGYYRWTQYIFLKMHEAGLVYQKEAEVNWDPVDGTVLAEEQIGEDGRSWRSGAKVEKKFLQQWYIRTTAFAKALYDGLDEVNPELWKDIIMLQRNWIRVCDGCRLEFPVQTEDGQVLTDTLSVFTPNPECVYGISHIALAPTHKYAQTHNLKSNQRLNEDMLLTMTARNPLTGSVVPLVLSCSTKFDEFNDSHLAIPSISEEDRALARKLSLPFTEVLTADGQKLKNSGSLSGMKREAAKSAVMKVAQERKVGGHPVSSRLRDWLISRQRYWGTPIPMVHCPQCKAVPVPYDELPVELPPLLKFSGKGVSPLSSATDWLQTKCPKCGGPAKRETDTMDTFVDSSWYYLRYLDPNNPDLPFDPKVATDGLPVDLYVGGKEHAVMHLYYARFFSHFLHSQGWVPTREPFVNLLTQGMVLGQSLRLKGSGLYLRPSDVDFSGARPVAKETGEAVLVDWEKMSKSKHNGVDPEEVIEEFGVDSTRLCILFNVAPQSDRKWSNEAFRGILNWQRRVWSLVTEFRTVRTATDLPAPPPHEVERWETQIRDSRNYFLKEVSFHFNKTFLLSVAISRLQGFTNDLKKVPRAVLATSTEAERAVAELVIMLAPLAPCFASELWSGLAPLASRTPQFLWSEPVLRQSWPTVDLDHELLLYVKINGRELTRVGVARKELDTLTADQALCLATETTEYQKWVKGKPVLETSLTVEENYCATLAVKVEERKKGEKQKARKKKKKVREIPDLET